MNRKFATAGAALSLTILLGACSTAAPASTPVAPMSASSSPTASSTAMSESDIVETAAAAGDFKTLTAALKAAGLDETLKGPGPFTVFAPTNAAFDKLPAGTLDGLLKPEKKDDLADILQYHVSVGVYKEDALRDGQVLGQVNGGNATISKKDGKLMINGANVVGTVPASNGIVYIIDAVLLPPAKK